MLTQNLLTQSWKALEHNSAVCRIHISLCSERLWSWDNIIILPRTYAIAPKYTKKHTNFQLIFGLLPRWFQDLRYSIWRALLVYFPSRAWHTFCQDTIFVGLTAQECAENQKTNCGCVFASFGGVERTRNVTRWYLIYCALSPKNKCYCGTCTEYLCY